MNRNCFRFLLFGVLIFCACNNDEHKTTEAVNASNDAYQQAFTQAINKMENMEESKDGFNETGKIKKEELASEENMIRSMLQGTWEWSGRTHVYGSMYENVSCRLVVDGNHITFYGNNGVMDQGDIKDIDMAEGVISFGSSSRVEFDFIDYSRGICLYYSKDEGKRFKKVSSSCSSGAYARGTGSSNSSERDALLKKLDKYNQEYFSVMGEYQSARDPMWKMQRLQTLKSVNGNCIHYARQLGDRKLLEEFLKRDKA
ncbi:MAG: hypothetical protein J5711_08605 [Bacteroidales bacterium]|nr:hypothetical protein [Bacteroidales bacterium]